MRNQFVWFCFINRTAILYFPHIKSSQMMINGSSLELQWIRRTGDGSQRMNGSQRKKTSLS